MRNAKAAAVTSSSDRHLRSAFVVLCFAALPAVAAEPPIDAGVASLYVGRKVTVEGVVTAAERDGWIVRLDLGSPPQTLRVQLVLGILSRFPENPEAYYLGKEIRVYGEVAEFRGQPEIILREPDRIVVVGGDDDPIPAERNVRVLENRVRELEDRLQVLESQTTPTAEPAPAAPAP